MLFNGVNVIGIFLIIKDMIQFARRGLIFDHSKIGDFIDFINDFLIAGIGDLSAVLAVDLVAIIIGRIMRGGNDDAGHAALIADGKGQLRRSADTVKDIGRNAVGV